MLLFRSFLNFREITIACNGILLEIVFKIAKATVNYCIKNRHFLRIDCFARGMKSFKRKNRRLNGIAFYGNFGTFDVKSVHINHFHIHIEIVT